MEWSEHQHKWVWIEKSGFYCDGNLSPLCRDGDGCIYYDPDGQKMVERIEAMSK
jgi:hypothetical protein